MKVLVLNCGSSSLKYRLFDLEREAELAAGLVERIGESVGRIVHRSMGLGEGSAGEQRTERPVPDHEAGLRVAGDLLRQTGALHDWRDLGGIGHRVVHGGERFREPTRIDATVLEGIRAVAPLAPLHNPANLTGIEVALRTAPKVPQVAVFDTAFHQTMPPRSFLYALPYELYEKHGVRRYGFHGTSHGYVARAAADHLGRPLGELNLITLHLGNGASAAAIAGGRCVDTSMGLTPLEGLVMGTRCGDLDPAIHFHLQRVTGCSMAEVESLLNRESGLKGLCGENDMREILRRSAAGEARAGLALEIFCQRIRKYVGAYVAVLGWVDGVIFTGGIGENSAEVRWRVCDGLSGLGIEADAGRNAAVRNGVAEIHAAGSRVAVLVVPTNEELEIARLTAACVRGGSAAGPTGC